MRPYTWPAIVLLVLFGSHAHGQDIEYPVTMEPIDTLIAWKRGYVEGYTQSPSVRQGDTVEFKLSTRAAWMPGGSSNPQQCRMDIFRVTSSIPFGGGDQLMSANVNGTFAVDFHPLHDSLGTPIEPHDCSRFPYEYRRGCAWPTTTSFTIPNEWPSGFYYARVHLVNDTVYGRVPFVVRPREPARSQAKILCVISWNTYQAYNYWGGGSLYWQMGRFSSPDRWANGQMVINTVSFRRPFTDFWQEPRPGSFPITTQLGQVDLRERQFIAWAEENAEDYPTDYCVDADVNAAGGGDLLTGYQMLVFPGHSEYWSYHQRENIEHQQAGFKGRGGNLAFLAANNCYWKVDYRPAMFPPTANPDSMYCDKDDNGYWWRRQPVEASGVGGPEARFIGVQYMGNNDSAGYQGPDTLLLPHHWITRGTGLTEGSVLGRGHDDSLFVNRLDPIASGEADMIRLSSPATTEKIARARIRALVDGEAHWHEEGYGDTVLYSHVTYYEDTLTNSRVFAAGGFGWSHCLYGDDATAMRIMHRTILDHFSGKKYIGNVYSNPNRPLIWSANIELDGDVAILPNRKVTIVSTQVTIDSVLFVDGTCEVNGAVTVAGNGSLNINPGGVLHLKANATLTVSPSTYIVLESGGDVVFENGSRLVLNRATIEAGATLTIGSGGSLEVTPGGHIAFGDSAGLIAYGPLTARGTANAPITFDKLASASGWKGISVQSGTAPTELRHCVVTDAVTGVTANSSRFLLKESTIAGCGVGVDLSGSNAKWYYHVDTSLIENCSTAGVVIGDASNVVMRDVTVTGCGTGVVTTQGTSVHYRNVIENSCYDGVFAGEYSNPRFGDIVVGVPGNNVIRGNGSYAVEADMSTPFLGLGSPAAAGGHNSITGEGILVNAGSGAGVTAQLNWWGKYPPESWRFVSDWSSWIDYDPALDYDPNGGTGPMARIVRARNTEAVEVLPVESPLTPEGSLLREAMARRARGKAEEAIPLYAGLIRARPDAPEARVAAQELRNTFHDLIRGPADSSLHRVVQDSMVVYGERHPNPGVRRLAEALAAQELGHWGDHPGALGGHQRLLQSAVTDRERLASLFSLFMTSSDGLRDRGVAAGYLAQLTSRYSGDIRTRVAAAKFEVMPDRGGSTVAAASGLMAKADAQTTRPQEFRLHQNYPNPFNPATEIRYELPERAPVTIVVFDLLGRIVETLVEEAKEAGYHTVRWNAGVISSGVYFYRMTAGAFTETKRMLLVK